MRLHLVRALAVSALAAMCACAGVERSSAPAPTAPFARNENHGALLEDMTWLEAERALTRDAIVVIPIGAASKEHGPHLKLKNDWLLAQYFRSRLMERERVIIAPTIGYHFYPAFLEYPGSTSLRLETARDVVVDVVRSLAAYGPRRFYVLNTGVSTVRALAPAVDLLAKDGIVLRYTNLLDALAPIEKEIAEQKGGTHADEMETSMMLVIDPSSVDMTLAAADFDPAAGAGPLHRQPTDGGKHSPSGVWGDARLATRAKGEKLVAALTDAIVRDVRALRAEAIP